MLHITTMNDHERMSTRELLQTIGEAVERGETDFHISASGQHDIGGPHWNRDGNELRFTITNPGQRVGSMCLPNTRVIVEGSAPADVGWLNTGGTIAVRGDAGDTAGHCAAGGKIYIGGRAGTRSGSLMKHDPEHAPPELWILKSTGSFSFEFMSGGRAVVCGLDSQTLPSVLGDRPCVDMVGGVVYFRGPCPELPPDVETRELDAEDIAWLDAGLDPFLEAINKAKYRRELSLWKHWRKLVPGTGSPGAGLMPMASFRATSWILGGIFGDILEDDFQVSPLVATAALRLHLPVWNNDKNACADCRACLLGCPQNAVKRRAPEKNASSALAVYAANPARCIGCGICAAVCPAEVWEMLSPDLAE